jgi:hypothetical protein
MFSSEILLPKLTAAIGLHTNALNPIANSKPAVGRLTASGVVCRSAAISVLALRSEVLEKHAVRVVQLVTKTMMYLRHLGILSNISDALVSVLPSVFRGCETFASGAIVVPVGTAFSGSFVSSDMIARLE